jgi:hypothetical protein
MHSVSRHYIEISGQPEALLAFPRGKSPGTHKSLGGSQSRIGHFRQEINFLSLLGFKPRIAKAVA